jgi:trimeric autotransporter adhesin
VLDGEARDVSNPDVGADEFTQSNGIDMQAVSLVAPVSPKGCFTNGENVVIKVRNNSSVDLDLTTNPVTVTATVSGAATATLTSILNTGIIAAGTTRDVTLTGTLNMSTNGTYIFNAKTSVTGDVKVSNDAMAFDTRTKVTLTAGVINVTATSPYCLKGTPLLGNTTAGQPNGYDTIQWQRGTDFGTGYVGIANAYTTPYRDTIYESAFYRLMAVCGTDTLYTDETQVEVTAPKIIATIPAARCDGGKLTLQAFGSPLTQLTWYTDSTGANNTYTTGGSMVTPDLATTDTFYVSAKTGTCESLRTPVIATVNPSIKIITQPVGQVVCPASTVTFSVTATGAGRTYQWQKDNVNITGATDTFYTIPSTTAANVGEYKVIISGPCGALISSVATLNVASANSWVGIVSSDWNTAANWCGGIPTAATDVTIVPGTPYSPVVSGTGDVHTLSITKGATVSVAANGTLNIYGDFVNNKGTFNGSAGTVALVGTAAQTIGALTAGNLIVNSAGVTLGGNITVVTNLTLTSGQVTLGAYNLSISRTANGTVASHIITNSTGSVILTNLTTAVTAPIGFSATTFNPVTVGNGQGLSYNVRVAEGTIANLAETDKAINRTWTVTTTTVPASPVSITFQYADNEANANCNPAGLMDVGYYNGITYGMANSNGAITPTGTSAVRLVTLTTTQLGSYVVANQGAIKVTVDQFKVQLLPTVINGTSATLRISTPRTMRMEWMILDMAGQLVKKFNTVAGPGVNDINIQLPGLANGVYQLRATSDDGKLPTIRFMIQH